MKNFPLLVLLSSILSFQSSSEQNSNLKFEGQSMCRAFWIIRSLFSILTTCNALE